MYSGLTNVMVFFKLLGMVRHGFYDFLSVKDVISNKKNYKDWY